MPQAWARDHHRGAPVMMRFTHVSITIVALFGVSRLTFGNIPSGFSTLILSASGFWNPARSDGYTLVLARSFTRGILARLGWWEAEP